MGRKKKEEGAAPPAKPLPKWNDSMHVGEVFRVPLNEIGWPKSERDDLGDVEGLARDIAANGLQHPITVRRVAEGEGDFPWEGVAGRRRYEAVKLLGAREICCTELRQPTRARAVRAAENIRRRELKYVEEANIVGDMMAEKMAVAAAAASIDLDTASAKEQAIVRQAAIELVAEELGQPVEWVRERDFLAGCTGKVRQYALAGKLPMTHARLIMQVASPEVRDELAEAAAAGVKLKYGPGVREHPIEFRQLKEMVERRLTELRRVPWRLDKEFADAPACANCPHNSANSPGLFDVQDAPPGSPYETRIKRPEAVCRLRACYGKKSGVANRAINTAARRALKDVAEKGATLSDATAAHAPEFVPVDLVRRRAAELKKAKAEGAAGVGLAEAKKTAQQVAAERHRSALYKWRKTAEGKIYNAVRRNAVTAAALHLLEHVKLVDRRGEDRVARRVPDELIEAACNGTPNGLAEVAQRCVLQPYHLDMYRLGAEDVYVIAGKLGVALGEPPKLQDFLPKPKAGKGSGRRGGAKPRGKKRAGAAASGSFDEEEEA